VLFGTITSGGCADDPGITIFPHAFTLALIYRALIVECFDPGYLRSVGGWGAAMHFIFLVLVVLNLVAGFRALGTLMAVGLMMLPAASSRFWATEAWSMALGP
jgi:zinc/manganese transport system permease protein